MTSLELQAAAEQVAAARGTDPWKGLMLVLLHFIKVLTAPMELQPVLVAADMYWTLGKGTPDALKTATASCRVYLDAFETHTHLDNPDTKFALALICVLEPLGDADAMSGTADWFAGVVWDAW